MTYVTIMVCLAFEQSNERCLAIAGEMVERFDARVAGVAAAEFSPPLYFTSGEQADKMIERGRNAIKTRLSELESEFRTAMNRSTKDVEWRSDMEIPLRFVAREARAADIIVIRQSGGGVLTDPFSGVNPSDLVMQAGRPLLVVPDEAGSFDLRSVLVAWKDTAEARRAIVDSLPLLRKAKDVTIAEIAEDGSREAALNRTDDVVAWLSRHNIAANALVPEENAHAGVALDRIASSIGADLVVAGAYGHSRLSEWILGGVTQHLMFESTRCVLLSR
jgi:nucleotide-binding universal stress UspA family protein